MRGKNILRVFPVHTFGEKYACVQKCPFSYACLGPLGHEVCLLGEKHVNLRTPFSPKERLIAAKKCFKHACRGISAAAYGRTFGSRTRAAVFCLLFLPHFSANCSMAKEATILFRSVFREASVRGRLLKYLEGYMCRIAIPETDFLALRNGDIFRAFFFCARNVNACRRLA